MDEAVFEFAAEDGLRAELAEVVGVYRCVEAVEAKMGARIEVADSFNERDGQPRGGVHRNIERDQISGANRRFAELFAGEIEAGDFGAGAAQPRRRRCQPKRLPPQLIRRDEHNPHDLSLKPDHLLLFFGSQIKLNEGMQGRAEHRSICL